MAKLRITRLGHGGVLYRSPADKWVWVDRWGAAPNFAEEFRTPERVDITSATTGWTSWSWRSRAASSSAATR
jgi:hypothetical protein